MSERAKAIAKTSDSKTENLASQTKKPNFSPSINSPIDQILFLQRTVGNQALGRLLKSGVIQAKLTIGQPGDIYEQEADRVAEQVMCMPDPSTAGRKGVSKDDKFPSIQRMCTDCEEELHRQPMEEEEELVHAKEVSGNAAEVSPTTESQINSVRGGGQPLPKSVRAFFEPRFGEDFSQVRIHTDSNAGQSAKSVNAMAYAVGTDIVFGSGQYSPETGVGKKLIAHELTHVVQQGSSQHLGTKAVAQTVQKAPTDGDKALCEGAEFPPAAVWFSDPMLARIRADEALMAFGSVGQPVALVQQALVAWGCDEGVGHLLPKFGVDGIFGSETRAAVRTFQGRQGIQPDGIVGPITIGELDRFIVSGISTCPSGTTPATFVPESKPNTTQQVCLPPGTTPLKQTGVCGCKPEDIFPPVTTTADIDDDCEAKKCAPGFRVPGTEKCFEGKEEEEVVVCLGEGDSVRVRERKEVVLKDDTREVFLCVSVLGGKLVGKTVHIRERFLKDCAKPPPKSNDKPEPKESITAEPRIDPTFCPCGLFLFAITWKTTGRNGFIVQEINKDYEARNCDKEPCESNGTVNKDVKPPPRFWEAWEVDSSGNVNPNNDFFTQPTRKPTCGHWKIEGNVHFVEKISNDFQIGNVPEAGGLRSTTKEQTGLGPVLLKREAGGEWNCCGTNRKHEPVGGSGKELNDKECAAEFKALAQSNPELADLLKGLLTPR